MPIVEKISEMKKQGLKEEEIAQRLKEQGISPKEIVEALEQSNVKSAVSATEEMQPSVMAAPMNNLQISTEMPMVPQETSEVQEMSSQLIQPQMPQEMQQQDTLTQIQGYPNYAEESAYAYPTYDYEEYPPLDTSIITEIAEQIINEKMQKTEKQIAEMTKFKIETQGKINNIDSRLKRIEMMIDKLQISILGEIGSYGENIADLKQEMQATQESFSKILNPLSENIEELRKITGSAPAAAKISKTTAGKTSAKVPSAKARKRNGFENYLRG